MLRPKPHLRTIRLESEKVTSVIRTKKLLSNTKVQPMLRDIVLKRHKLKLNAFWLFLLWKFSRTHKN